MGNRLVLAASTTVTAIGTVTYNQLYNNNNNRSNTVSTGSAQSTAANNSSVDNNHSNNPTEYTEPENSSACRACAVTPGSTVKPIINNNNTNNSSSCPPCYAYSHSSCPLNRAELGRASWAYLHTLAAYYPDNPSIELQQSMSQYLSEFSRLYPCGYCADRSNEEIIRNPPRTTNQYEFSIWMCEIHNEVNERLNKPIFDCSMSNQRWKYGPKTGECN